MDLSIWKNNQSINNKWDKSKWWEGLTSKKIWELISKDLWYELYNNYWISIINEEKTILDKIVFEDNNLERVKIELLAIRELWKISDSQEYKKTKHNPSWIMN